MGSESAIPIPPDPTEPDGDSVYLDRGPELPTTYHEDRLDLLIRGPRSLFLQWELDVSLPATAPDRYPGTARPAEREEDRPGVPGSVAWGPVSPSSWIHIEEE